MGKSSRETVGLRCDCCRNAKRNRKYTKNPTERFTMAFTSNHPRITLIVPAHNEAGYLPRLLDSVDAARANYRHGANAVEVVVVDNRSTDSTAAIATDRGCRVVR